MAVFLMVKCFCVGVWLPDAMFWCCNTVQLVVELDFVTFSILCARFCPFLDMLVGTLDM